MTEEKVTFTILDCVAHTKLIEDARSNNQKATCWMVTSEEFRKEAREKALTFFNEPLMKRGALITPMTEETFERVLGNISPSIMMALSAQRKVWEEAELERDEERKSKSPNPHAWFV